MRFVHRRSLPEYFRRISQLMVWLVVPCIVLVPLDAQQQMGVATGNGVAVPARPLPPGLKPPIVKFEDIAAKAGLTGVNVSGADHGKQYIVETTGNGVAILDYDNDGLPDILLINGGRLNGNSTDLKEGAATPYLYRNLGGLRFEDVTAKAGLAVPGWGQGVCAGDANNDGNVDVFVTRWGQNALFMNQGNGTFHEETKGSGLSTAHDRWSTGCAFFDFNRDGALDLIVAHYVELDISKTPRAGDKSQCMWKGMPVLCGPRGLPAETVSLYQNDGHGHFTDVSDAMHVTTPKDYYGFTPLIADFDNDGWPDIFISCDSTANLYFHNLHGRGFEEIGVTAGVAYNEDGREQAGMGVAAADESHRGFFDIFKTNFADDTHTLYRNNGKNDFTDATVDTGLAVNTRYLGWGTAFVDVDDDGWPDIVIADGHVYPEVDRASTGEVFKQQRLLYWNRRDGQFFDMSMQGGPGISATHSSRGLAIGDLDNDGDEEVVILNMGEAPSLLKNMAPRLGNSLLVRAINAHGSDAIGARITVASAEMKQMDEVRSGGSFMSQSDFRLHFGLGKASAADITVRWPDGQSDNFSAVKAGQIVTVQQGKGIVKRTPFASPVK